MAPKSRSRRPKKEPTPPPPPESSSSDSSEDSEQETDPQDLPDHGDDGEEDSPSESESEFEEAKYEVKPIADLTNKRSVESAAGSHGSPKRAKTDAKKPSGTPFERVWSESDEIALLNGMVELKNLKGSVPKNVSEVVDFMKGKLGAAFTAGRIRDKIRRMKSRFSNALKKRMDGKDPIFSDPHELIAYEISKQIWGDELGNSEANGSKDSGEEGNVAKEAEAEAEVVDFWSKYPYLNGSLEGVNRGRLIRETLELIGDAKAKELNEKWKELFTEEVEIYYKKLGLMLEQSRLALRLMIE